MPEGTLEPLAAVLHLIEDPSHPQLYLIADATELTADPQNPKLYMIGS